VAITPGRRHHAGLAAALRGRAQLRLPATDAARRGGDRALRGDARLVADRR
jgi:hypothetical protein